MSLIKQEYSQWWKFFRQHIFRIWFICLCCMVGFGLLSYFLFLKNMDSAIDMINQFMNNIRDSGVMNENGDITIFALFWNNLKSALIANLLGFLPFIFLPILSLIANGSIMGAAFAVVGGYLNYSMSKLMVLGIAPHGIFEVPAYVLAVSLGIYLCLILTRKITNREKDKVSDGYIFANILKSYVLVIIPMLIVAAVIETYLTPVLMAAGGMA